MACLCGCVVHVGVYALQWTQQGLQWVVYSVNASCLRMLAVRMLAV